VGKRRFEILNGFPLDKSQDHTLSTLLLWISSISFECHRSATGHLEGCRLGLVAEQSFSGRCCFCKICLVAFGLSSLLSCVFLLLPGLLGATLTLQVADFVWTGDRTRMKTIFFLVSHVELKPYLWQFSSSETEREKWTEFRKMVSGREEQDQCPQMEQ